MRIAVALLVLSSLTLHTKIGISQVLLWAKDAHGIALLEDGEKIFYYQKTSKSAGGKFVRANYMHPLYGLHGEVLTEDFPADHLHHRGVFWAWHQLYIEGQQVGDGWICEDLAWEVQKIKTNIGLGHASLTTKVWWMGKKSGGKEAEKLMREETTISYQPIEGGRWIDFDISLTALHRGTAIGGSEDKKGYSGFSARTVLPEDVTFRSHTGEITPQTTALDAGGWVDILANFDTVDQQRSGITIMNHPSNPQPFAGWILRSKKSMQNAAFPGREPFAIRKGKTIHLRYRILIHPADWTLDEINVLYHAYQKM